MEEEKEQEEEGGEGMREAGVGRSGDWSGLGWAGTLSRVWAGLIWFTKTLILAGRG